MWGTAARVADVEYRLSARDGRVVWVRDEGVIVFDDDAQPLYLQGYLMDITAEREAQAQLRQLALYDALTGLVNRAFFHEQLQHAVSIRKQPPEQTALLHFDLNDFKNVNDRFGHDIGDEVLATLGRRIQDTLRAGDTAARLGGDEFAIVIPSLVEPAEAVRVAERLLEAIRAPIDLDRCQLSVSASIGISVGGEAEVMLQEADAAMYRAKRQQDVGYAFYDAELDTAAVRRSRRVIELREAVEAGQFTLDYQPVIAERNRRPRERARLESRRRRNPDSDPTRDRPGARLPQRPGLLLRLPAPDALRRLAVEAPPHVAAG